MKKFLHSFVRFVPAAVLSWGIATVCFALHSDRSVASMALVLEVLGVAALGDWLLAVMTSVAASLAFSWYFVDAVGSFKITSLEGAVTYSMLLITALTGSHLAIRAQRRAAEAIRRREEMERLQQLGNALLASSSVSDAAEKVVTQIVDLFGVEGASLKLEDLEGQFGAKEFSAGQLEPDYTSRIWLHPGASQSVLELHGIQPSPEVRSALANLINLVLDRARGAEERARIENSQRGEELRNTVLNALAHNFRTPLTSIKAAASMLRGSSGLGNGPDRELAIVIDEEADRLDLLIRESLNLARIEARQQNPRVEICSLASIAEAVRSRVARYLGGRKFIVDIPDQLPSLCGDRFLFEQMLMQVVDNAWKYSRPDSRVEITAVEEEGALIVTVRNEGNQIPEDERSKIFAKFYRGVTNGRLVEGTGLGLAIAKAIAEAHGGRIWLDSEPTGPAFRFSLPAGVGSAELPPERLTEETEETNDNQQNHSAHRR